MITLAELLKNYSESGAYPMHMPGHKRNTLLLPDYSIDLTEIEGFDDLHCPRGILKDCMDYAAKVYGSRDTLFSVNGSTCALHAAIYASTKAGDKILAARNCHKSVYHMIAVRGLRPVYTYTDKGYPEAEEIRRLLEREPDIKAAVITSPSYDGTVSDIREIAGICHDRNVILIVDEAHGAHLPFAEKAGVGQYFTESALTQGADIVIHSLHKTLPAMTQTAVLHRMSDRVSTDSLRQALSVFESSSPSYVLMASIDACIHYMEEHCKELFETYAGRLRQFYETAEKEFPQLFEPERLTAGNGKEAPQLFEPERLTAGNGKEAPQLFEPEQQAVNNGAEASRENTKEGAVRKSGIRRYDPGKILICGKNLSMTGGEIYDILINDYGLMPEMSAGDYCLCMTSVCDTEEGFRRLEHALKGICAARGKSGRTAENTGGTDLSDAAEKAENRSDGFHSFYPPHTDKCFCTPAEAERYKRTKISLSRLYSALGDETIGVGSGIAGGKAVAAELTAVYPPGAPVLVPGEYITKETIQYIREALAAGNEVHGVHEGCIYVLSEE